LQAPFLISQNGEFSPHEKTLHGPCVFYTFMNGSSSTNTIITHGMVVDVIAGGSIFATKFGVIGFENRYPLPTFLRRSN
jgi:hypothetical protein